MAKKIFLFSLVLFAAVLLGRQQRLPTPQVSAKFEVAGIARGDRIPFKLVLRNLGTNSVADLSVVATAGQSMQSFPAPMLEPGEEKTMEGELIIGEGEGNLEFSARVIGKRFSYRSPTIVVARQEGVGGGRLYSQIQQQPLNAPIEMGRDLDLQELAFGNLEPVEQESDVQHLITQVEQHQCDASRQTLEVYQELGNSEADRFLLSSL